ncbi:MAG: hypothetical protein LBQ79_02140 [Deltaproteobacteria bacterium]|nr:hypothetical protein [Deltaproteobacteria bacterium]
MRFTSYRSEGRSRQDFTHHNFAPERVMNLNNGLNVLGTAVDGENRFRS